MTISSISNCNFSKLPSIETQSQLDAIEIFGKNLAHSLKIRDNSWEKVIESWNISLVAWKTIKESNNNFSEQPNRIACEIQVNNGLIFEVEKTWNNEEIIKGNLITPHGYINLKFHSTKSMNQFLESLEKVFHKKFLNPSIYHAVYSFTLDPNKTAEYKPSHFYDKCGCALDEEFGENEYCRTEALKIYKILSDHAGITMEGQAI